MTELVPTTTPDSDQERWGASLLLVGAWLLEHSDHTRRTYADAIGWPCILDGEHKGRWRDYNATRSGHTWLNWCRTRGVHLFDARRLHVLAWIDLTTGSTLSKRSRAQLLTVASAFYKWSIHEGHTEINPVAAVDRKKKGLRTSKDPSPTRSLSKTEAIALIAAADQDPVKSVRLRTSAIIALLFIVGPRVGEVCKATLSDMRVQDGRRVLHSEVKGGKRHLYPLPPEVCQRIDAYLAQRDDINRLPVRRGQESAGTIPLFATSTGKHIGRREVLTLVKRISVLAGLDDPKAMHPHVGRHTMITQARRLGFATADIQATVGHENAATTDGYGTHILALERSPVYEVAKAFAPEAQVSDD